MATADILDRLTRHQIFVQRLSAGQARIAKNKLDDLIEEVRDKLGETLTATQRARYLDILDELEEYAREVYGNISTEYQQFGLDFLDYEADFSNRVFSQATGVDFDRPAPVQLQSGLFTPLFNVAPQTSPMTIGQALARFGQTKTVEFMQTLRDGFVLGLTSQQIVNGVASIVSLQKNQIETLIRTATNHLATQARNATIKENEDVVDGYEWVATLDSRTSLICASRDGQIYPISDDPERSPKPPAHYGCRSTIVPVVKKEFDLLADEDERRPFVGPDGKKGQVDGKITYEKWLRRQPESFQIDVLGRGRFELFKNKKLPLSRFVDQSGRELSLQELQQLDNEFN